MEDNYPVILIIQGTLKEEPFFFLRVYVLILIGGVCGPNSRSLVNIFFSIPTTRELSGTWYAPREKGSSRVL